MTRIERFRFRLRMLWLGLTMKPIAGAEDPPAADPSPSGDPAPDPKPAEPPKADPKPPWGSDDDFDPERAWKLIQDVRSDAEKAKAEREKAQAELKKRQDAEKTAEQKLEERATTSEQRATKAEQEAARLRVALKKGLTETQAKRLVGETEEELEADAEELLESFKGEGGQEPARRPRERLRPGAAPSADPEPSDPAELAKQVSRGW